MAPGEAGNKKYPRRPPPLQLPIQQVVTFASDPFGGNPAFVVTLDAPRPAPILQTLCRHLQETVLAVLRTDGDAVRVSYFTPEGRHSGPGHSTHAAAWVALNRLRPGAAAIDLMLDDGGRRTVRREDGRLAVDWPVMPFEDTDAIDDLTACLGLRPRETFLSAFGVIAVFANAAEVAGLLPDLARIARLRADTVIATASAADADFAIRVFAPKLNLPEDPVCGTAHRILVPLWAERLNRSALVSRQLSRRGGKLYCRVEGNIVTIGGEANLFIDGTVALPD
jgi:PhzF family phenazine biosynthesis protein